MTLIRARSTLAPCVATLLALSSFGAFAVDGVVLIDQSRALAGGINPGDGPGFPITISQPGSYRLSGNLTVTGPGLNAIEITASNVTLDLNGFSIVGTGRGSGGGQGIVGFAPGGTSIVVTNGSVRNMGSNGINLDSNCRVEKVLIAGNGGYGVAVTTGSNILYNNIVDNSGDGVLVGQAGVVGGSSGFVTGNLLNANGGAAIHVRFGGRTLVAGNVATFNTGPGLLTGATATVGYTQNIFTENNGSGAQALGGLQLGLNLCNLGLCP